MKLSPEIETVLRNVINISSKLKSDGKITEVEYLKLNVNLQRLENYLQDQYGKKPY